MTLTFEYILDAGAGLYLQVIHTTDNLLRFIYLTADGTVAGSTADQVLGLYDSLSYMETGRISPDEAVSYLIGNGEVLRTAVIFFYCSNEGVSMLENATHIGLPVPQKLKDILEQLHNRTEDK